MSPTSKLVSFFSSFRLPPWQMALQQLLLPEPMDPIQGDGDTRSLSQCKPPFSIPTPAARCCFHSQPLLLVPMLIVTQMLGALQFCSLPAPTGLAAAGSSPGSCAGHPWPRAVVTRRGQCSQSRSWGPFPAPCSRVGVSTPSSDAPCLPPQAPR